MQKDKTKADIILKDFWRDNNRFADLFNTVIFDGEKVIEPELLQEMDTDVSGVIELKEYKETIARFRDVIKKMAYGIEFVVMGIENQKAVHYAMPLRTMIYDALGYLKEYKEITKKEKGKDSKETQDEFLSKMKKGDYIHPIVTIIIYYNEKPWDGPFSLKDMMWKMPERIDKIFSDYKMNLLQVRESGKYTFSNEDVETVFHVSRNIFQQDFEEIKRCYENRNIKAELATVIGKITDSSEIIQQGMKSKEDVNMCTALDNLKKQGIEQGIEQKEKSVIINMLKKGYSHEEICEITGAKEKDVSNIENNLL